MISDDDAERAADWLRDNASEAAKARAERLYMEEFRKSLKAIIMAEHIDESGIAQERYAYSDERYIMHLDAMKTAIEVDEKSRFLREAALAKLDAWRTFAADRRGKM